MSYIHRKQFRLLAKTVEHFNNKALKVFVVVVASMASTVAMPGFAAPTWSLPSTIGFIQNPHMIVAQGNNGDAAAVFVDNNSTRAMVSIQRAGGTWTRPVKLFALGTLWTNPHLTFSPDGSAVVSYGDRIFTLAPNSSTWKIATIDVSCVDQRCVSPNHKKYELSNSTRVRFDQKGNGFATGILYEVVCPYVGHSCTPVYPRVIPYMAAYSPKTGWSPATDSSSITGNINTFITLDVNGSGDAVMTWGTPSDYKVALKHGNGPWSAPVVISHNQVPSAFSVQFIRNQKVAISDDGSVTIVWEGCSSHKPLDCNLYVSQATASGIWRPVVVLAVLPKGMGGQLYYDVVADKAGNVTVVWKQGDYSLDPILVSTKKAGSTAWTPPQTLSNVGLISGNPNIAVSKDSTAMVVGWKQFDGYTNTGITGPMVSRYSPLNGWTKPVLLEQNPKSLYEVAVSAGKGNSVRAIWSSYVNGNVREVRGAKLIP